jgi:hypothetical protein
VLQPCCVGRLAGGGGLTFPRALAHLFQRCVLPGRAVLRVQLSQSVATFEVCVRSHECGVALWVLPAQHITLMSRCLQVVGSDAVARVGLLAPAAMCAGEQGGFESVCWLSAALTAPIPLH